MASKPEQLRSEITDQIISALESGHLPPWRKPWNTTNTGPHRNLVSGKPYSGVKRPVAASAENSDRKLKIVVTHNIA